MRLSRILVCLIALLPAAAAWADEPLVLPTAERAPSAWSWFGDVLLREDRVRDIPRIYESDIQRVFGRARVGVLYDPIPELEIGAAIKLAAASNDNSEDRSYNLNERSNDTMVTLSGGTRRDLRGIFAGAAVVLGIPRSLSSEGQG